MIRPDGRVVAEAAGAIFLEHHLVEIADPCGLCRVVVGAHPFKLSLGEVAALAVAAYGEARCRAYRRRREIGHAGTGGGERAICVKETVGRRVGQSQENPLVGGE